MTTYYFDSSVLVKCYTRETGTDWVRSLVQSEQSHYLITIRLLGPELIAALFRKVRTGELPRAVARHLAQDFRAEWERLYDVIEVNAVISDLAMDLVEKYGLRGYDAVHLATAIILHKTRQINHLSDLIFLAADNNLLRAATAEGLRTDNPNHYP